MRTELLVRLLTWLAYVGILGGGGLVIYGILVQRSMLFWALPLIILGFLAAIILSGQAHIVAEDEAERQATLDRTD